MTAAAQMLELASYVGIIGLGGALVWRKGRALLSVLRSSPVPSILLAKSADMTLAFDAPTLRRSAHFAADDGLNPHFHGPDCGHMHMPDPGALGGTHFDWRAAAVTILTAGARPCSGAILVLVFALAQGLFLAGIAATFAMAVGTAVTTGALAIAAVSTKDLAVRIAGAETRRNEMIGRLVELVAAACVLAFGLALLGAAVSGPHGA